MRLDELLLDVVCVDHAAERRRLSIGKRVVADDAFDLDAEGGVERDRSLENTGGGDALLVVVDLCVSNTGVVVNDCVDVVVADPAAADLLTATVSAPPAAVGDAAQFLHIDVDQRAGMVVLVAVRGPSGRADHRPGDWIQFAQQWRLMAAQHPPHGRGLQAEAVRDEHRTGATAIGSTAEAR